MSFASVVSDNSSRSLKAELLHSGVAQRGIQHRQVFARCLETLKIQLEGYDFTIVTFCLDLQGALPSLYVIFGFETAGNTRFTITGRSGHTGD